jgi:hemerythrin-like domain-containing protein
VIQIGAPAATIDEPIEHLMACHRRIEQRLDALVNAADRMHDERAAASEAIRKSFHFLDTNGSFHTADEEESLFPRLRPKLSAEELAFVDGLEAQHGEADAIYRELRKLAIAAEDQPSADAIQKFGECASRLRAPYLRHIQSEDRILTAIARRCLDGAEIEQISEEMRQRRR